MYFKVVLLTFALYIHVIRKCVVQGEFVDIVLPFKTSENNYTRFINFTKQQFEWLSSVLCDNNTYSYSITYDRDNGSLVSNSSTTFMMNQVDPSIHLKEFTCTSQNLEFRCVRIQIMQACDIDKTTWIYLNADFSSSCSDKCVSMCPHSPIQDILFMHKTQRLKNNISECQNSTFYPTSTSKSESTFYPTSTSKSESTFVSTYSTGFTLMSASIIPSKVSTVSTANSKSTFLSTVYLSSSSSIVKDTSHDSLPVILGASVGGGLGLIVILIIVLVVCVRKRRQRSHIRKSVHEENNQDINKENVLRGQLQRQQIEDRHQKIDITVLNKSKDADGLFQRKDWTKLLDSNTVSSDTVTYFGSDVDGANITVTNDDVSNENRNQSRYPPGVFSNPVFGGLDADYSCIQDTRIKRKNSVSNVGDVATDETSPNNEHGSTYSKLGENIRSYSDTYNALPIRNSGKKVHTSLGQNYGYGEIKASTNNKNTGDDDGRVDGASDDVYAKVNKSSRDTH